MCQDVLSGMAHETLEAATGQQGLEIAERESPDVIVLDLLMPDLAGEEVLTILQERHPSVPVIILTANTQEKAAEECLALGASHVLNKFVNPDEFKSALNKVLGAKR
jgi:CheY-like chemotaxis protein